MSDPKLEQGWVDQGLAAEFPALRLWYSGIERGSGRSPDELKERLRAMSDRFTGPKAVQLRQEPVPWSYRVFFRQVGIDPDENRTPVEALALERMRAGGFKSRNLLDDAITIATIETGVPLIAFDADQTDGVLGLRLAGDGEVLGSAGRPLSSGQIVVADATRSLAVLFADMDPERGVTPDTRRMLLAAVQVSGVPDISVEEAMWTAMDIIGSGA